MVPNILMALENAGGLLRCIVLWTRLNNHNRTAPHESYSRAV